jgi:hypothetical protein
MKEGAKKPPVRFQFESCGTSSEKISPNMVYSESLNVPLIQIEKPHGRHLAVCGSGPSIKNRLKELRKWKGEVWAINGTVQYLLDHGIDSTFVSVDPSPRFDLARIVNAKYALASMACDPAVFDAFKGRVKGCYITPSEKAPFVCTGGCTTATRMPMLALHMGYRNVTFFGCEGSYENDTHVYADFKGELELWIDAGGNRYRTCPEALMQSQYLSSLIINFPQGFSEKCGGLLRAMIKHPDTWTMTYVSDALKQRLEMSYERQASLMTQQGAQL